ncbi:MAG: SRPBCC family protein [Solirubrobacterales bacterium]
MGPISAEVTIDALRESVWLLISDLALRPSFCDHFQSEFRLERIESSGVGASARFRVEAPRMQFWMETVVEEADEPHRLFERGRGGRLDRVPIHTVWELAEGAGQTTDARVTFWTEPAGHFDRIRERMGARRWYRRQWRETLRRLRGLAESGEAIESVGVAGGDPLPR